MIWPGAHRPKKDPEFYRELFGTPCIWGQSNSTTLSTTTTSTTTTTALQTCALRWIGDVVGLARCSVIATFPHKWQILFSSQISLTKISERLRRDVLNFVQFAWWQLFWHQFSCNLDVLSDWGLGLIHLDLQWIWDRDGLRESLYLAVLNKFPATKAGTWTLPSNVSLSTVLAGPPSQWSASSWSDKPRHKKELVNDNMYTC